MGRPSIFVNRLRRRMIDAREATKHGKRWGLAFVGGQAFDRGDSPCRCPFELDTNDWACWMAGWRGRYDRHFGRLDLAPLEGKML
jgi:hypothetical protein